MHKNTVRITGSNGSISSSDLAVLAQPKAMPHMLGLRPGLWIYYRWDEQRSKGLRKAAARRFGRQPVYFDEQLARNASAQMRQYLFNMGHFEATTSFELRAKRKKANVSYIVHPGPAYVISHLQRTVEDPSIAGLLDADTAESLLSRGKRFNAYEMDAERDRITNLLKNNGYFYFRKDFIRFEADSNKTDKSVRLNLRIEAPSFLQAGAGEVHQSYFVRNIFIYPQHQPFGGDQLPTDTLIYRLKNPWNNKPSQLTFVSPGNPGIKPSAFRQVIQFYQGEPVSIDRMRQTYKGLNNLKIFRASNIVFDTTASQVETYPIQPGRWIDAHVYLQRARLHAYSVEVEGTNSGGDLGMRGSLVYTNRNLFSGAEVLRIRFNGGLEAQRLSTGETENRLFNTRESGLDASLLIPRFVSPIRLRRFAREYLPKTTINLGYSSQNRPNYDRAMLRFSFGYDWMATSYSTHFFSPASLSSIKVNLSPEFEDFLNQITNQRLRNQYNDHLIFGMRYSYIFTNQNINRISDFHYLRINAESAGNLLSAMRKLPLFGKENDYTTLFGIRYAQFVRLDLDYRYYKVFRPELRLVFRGMAGTGIPFGNSEDLPFERSFYAGGANGMRAWPFRQLGPGSFTDTLKIERYGSMQLETNVEFRFPLYSYLKGAIFADAGNIWTYSGKDEKNAGDFAFNRFYKEIALDAGIGFRLDFSFFVFRVDAAVPLRDPSLPEAERWRFNDLKTKNIAWNFGIGYPF